MRVDPKEVVCTAVCLCICILALAITIGAGIWVPRVVAQSIVWAANMTHVGHK